MAVSNHAPVAARYVGRFAPSPTGPLHLGSLMAALASCLEARVRNGIWLLRIEDLDPPRTVPGTAELIAEQLARHGFAWDGAVIRQSVRTDRYEAALARLSGSDLVYPCGCSRKEVAAIAHAGVDGPVYPGSCRSGLAAGRPMRAWRLKVPDEALVFRDAVQGDCTQHLAHDVGDFVVRRADGLFAYQLAVVVDDAEQGVSAVVRGADLLDSTPRQIWLQRCLGYAVPEYAHIPVLVNADGEKLSKQTQAPGLDPRHAAASLWQALALLGQSPPSRLRQASVESCWDWALHHWQLDHVPNRRTVEYVMAG
ncbi:tRNA glutamyl-Q(34) synthetase GluQRS [Chitiniphilus purpureus]|uniref:Glutamyl-Q tRNA(Asp) synthetase n=1 Tax=Chitiniphilus purpureus TaxID=2981137 RepID=A0ABY6DHB3_9NEIS|nr:tRNA glutamyl-Q(34) synthetase GluQRS [Chitiniphilus sp. CD1]UXY13732.1 tRNA glutamyl-Q(34) synthetase GluQRS [Chitiniphilus sp. CD1]